MRRRLVVAAAVTGGRLQFRSKFSAACDGGSYNLIHKHKHGLFIIDQWSQIGNKILDLS